MDANAFRAGMRRLAAAVSIVTAFGEDGPAGATVSSVTSLSADPESLLVCLNQATAIHATIAATSHFAVNVLRSCHSPIANSFADPQQRARRFEIGDWDCSDALAPYLKDAQVSFTCQLEQLIGFGTHSICIGKVLDVRIRAEFDPLVYAEGAMSRIAPLAGAASAGTFMP